MVGIEGIDLENYLAHHHDMIVLTAIQSSKQVTEDYMQDMQRKWLMREWDTARAQFAERIGHRPVEQHTSAPPLLLDYVTPQKAAKDVNVPAIVYVHSEMVKHMSSIEHNQEPVQTYPSFTLLLHDELDKCESDVFFGNGADKALLLSRHDIAGYKTCLSLLSHMLGEQRRKHAKFGPFNKPGYFSPICYERNLMNSVTAAQDRHDILAYGSVVYYNQVALDLFTKRASPIGERNPGQTIRSLIKAHVQSLGNSHSIYAFVYCCLRAGEYQAAIDEITEFNHSVHNKAMEVDGNVLHLLNAIIILINQYIVTANPAGSHSTPSKASNVLDSIGNLSSVISAIHKLYQAEDAKYQNNQPVDVYKLFVYNLLAVVDKSHYSSGYDIAGYALEDFIWSQVFSIFVKRLFGSYMESLATLGITSPLKNKMALVPVGQDAQSRFIRYVSQICLSL
ncbi:hypothetical protein EON65_25000 [archaeon]|nr:MAG: hypothetical protein EON65_25000 [archaeon]